MGTKNFSKEQLKQQALGVFEKVDSWQNFFTGLGVKGIDKRTGAQHMRSTVVDREQLTSLYRFDGLTKKLIDVVIHDMTRNGFIIQKDVDDLLKKSTRKLKFKSYMKEALTWQDLYGGAIIFLGLDDGLDAEEPLNENNLNSIEFMKVYDRWQINLSASDLYNDPKKPKYGEPEKFNITPVHQGSPFVIHESRVLRFDGEMLPDRERIANQYWGDSVIQAIYERLRGMGSTYANIENIVEEFIIGVLKVPDLDAKLQIGSEEKMLKRMNYLDIGKHIINSILIDMEENYERLAATVTGIEELVDKLERAVASARNIPVSILFGDTAKGLNASGVESEVTRRYYDYIGARQNEKMVEQIERFIYLLMISKSGPTNGKIIDDWSIEFPSLWEPTEKEKAETRKINAEADKIYWEMDALWETEIALSRHGGLEYGNDIILSEAHRNIIEQREKALASMDPTETGKTGSKMSKNPEEEETITEEE